MALAFGFDDEFPRRDSQNGAAVALKNETKTKLGIKRVEQRNKWVVHLYIYRQL